MRTDWHWKKINWKPTAEIIESDVFVVDNKYVVRVVVRREEIQADIWDEEHVHDLIEDIPKGIILVLETDFIREVCWNIDHKEHCQNRPE